MTQTQLLMPKMGESITEGTILNWLVQEGEAFDEGDILLEVATDKVDNEVPAPSAGIMKEHLFETNSIVAVGHAIAVYEAMEGSESTKKERQEKVTVPIKSTQKTNVSKKIKPTSVQNFAATTSNTFISPLVDSIARKYVEADMTDLVAWRNAHKVAFQKKYGERLTFTPLFVEAVANAVKDFPMINVSVDGTSIIVKEHINIGMATALPSGNLIVPVVKNADQKNLQELATDVNRLVALARENKLAGDDIKGSTFTISNVGTFGSIMGTPIINQPEAAILATGIIKKRAEVMERPDGDAIEIRQMMYLSLSFDHRIVDGYLGGSFLRRIADNLEQFDPNRTI